MLLKPMDTDVQGDVCRLHIVTGEKTVYTTSGTRPLGSSVAVILAESAEWECVPVGYVLKRKRLTPAAPTLAGW